MLLLTEINFYIPSFYNNKIRNQTNIKVVGFLIFIEIIYNDILLFMITIKVTDLLL